MGLINKSRLQKIKKIKISATSQKLCLEKKKMISFDYFFFGILPSVLYLLADVS
jgi:hypothetical protein